MKDFYHKFSSAYPGKIKDWQTDNGLENLGVLDEDLKRDNIPHFFSCPRCPKINGVVERFNPPTRNSPTVRSWDAETLFRFGEVYAPTKRIIKIPRP